MYGDALYGGVAGAGGFSGAVSTTQAQGVTVARQVIRSVAVSQAQAPAESGGRPVAATATQPRAATVSDAVGWVVAASQSRSASVARRQLTCVIPVTQDQAASATITKLIFPVGIPSTGARFGRPEVILTGLTLFPSGIASTSAVGTPTVALAPAAQYILARGWRETEHLGVPGVSHTTPHLAVPGIPPSSTVGKPIILTRPPDAVVPQNVLVDRLTGETYPWPLNHATEDAVKTLGRRLTRSGISASGKLTATRRVFLIRQPSHPGPMHLILHGSMLDRDQQQYQTFIRFFNECDDRTFDYIDASGDSYHVSIVQFDARRKNAPSRVDGSYFTYSLEVEVINVNQGAYKGYAV